MFSNDKLGREISLYLKKIMVKDDGRTAGRRGEVHRREDQGTDSREEDDLVRRGRGELVKQGTRQHLIHLVQHGRIPVGRRAQFADRRQSDICCRDCRRLGRREDSGRGVDVVAKKLP